MVQFFQKGPSRKSVLAEVLGQSLGAGLGNMTGTYFANKALDRALSDNSYNEKPLPDRLSALDTALRPHGERGSRLLQQRMGIEEAYEQKRHEALQNRQQGVLNKLLMGQELSPEESQSLTPEMQIAAQKALNPKPVGGISAQSVPEDVSKAIGQVLSNSSSLNSDALAQRFDQAGIPRAFSNSYIENRRRQDEQASKLGQEKTSLAFKRDNQILEEADAFRNLIPTEEVSINAMEDAITQGDQSFWSADNLAELTGLELFRTAKGGQFKTGAKTFLINNVSKFGARPNQYIEQQIADSLAKIGRSKEANLASLELIKFDSDVKKKYIDILDDIEEEGDYKPGTIGRVAQKRMKDYVEQKQVQLANRLRELQKEEQKSKGMEKADPGFMRLQNPETGERWDIPDADVDEALKAGWLKV